MDELLKQISENHELIDGYTAEQVTEAREALKEFAVAVKAGEIEADSEVLAEAKAISEKLTARDEALTAEAEARAAEIADLESALGIEAQVEDEEEPEVESPDEPEEDEPEAVVEEEKELVTASVTPGKLASRIPATQKPRKDTGPNLVASASGHEGDALTSAAQLGEMVLRKWEGMGRVTSQTTFPMATLDTRGQHKYTVKPGDNDGNARALAAIAQDASANGNLVAAGGFCAPAEQLYTFFNIASRAGILTLPTVNAPRGAISLPVSPSLGDFLGQSGIATEWTNTNDEDPTSPATKPVYTFVCPEFQECDVSAWPTILQFGNFAARFFPEAVANATSLALIAGERTVNAARIAFLVAAATAGNVEATAGGGLINLSRNLASNAADYRQTYGMDPLAPLDVVLPTWVPRALWADAIARDSTVEYGDLRRRIMAMFDELDLRAQFVYDFDDQTDGLFPETTDILMYAPGTVVELDGGTLDLGVVRDSTLNATNDFQTFSEPFVGWCQPGHEVRLLDEVGICASGETGQRVDIAC